MVFQEFLLFPHRAVRKNRAFPLRMCAAPLRCIMFSNSATFIAFVDLYLPMTVTTIHLSLLNFDLRLALAARACRVDSLRVIFEVIWPLNLPGTMIAVSSFALWHEPRALSAIFQQQHCGVVGDHRVVPEGRQHDTAHV